MATAPPTVTVVGFGLGLSLVLIAVLLLDLHSVSASAVRQSCRFDRHMGETYDKCSSVCRDRVTQCVADNTCLCQDCVPVRTFEDKSSLNVYDDVSCKWDELCNQRCEQANSAGVYGRIGRGQLCEFTDDFFNLNSSVCVCPCLNVPKLHILL